MYQESTEGHELIQNEFVKHELHIISILYSICGWK